jgi:protocatechuate 3,4-dioxygenase, alpha subunit
MSDQVLVHTASQTIGPFLHIALADPGARHAVDPGSPDAVVVRGTVTDGAGDPVPDALVETWQPDGLLARCPTDADGGYEIHTRRPPPVPTLDGTPQAPHMSVSVFARGLLDRVVTRLYFGDEAAANDADPTLAVVAAERRHCLVAEPDAEGGYRFDIRLQGDDESVFFSI